MDEKSYGQIAYEAWAERISPPPGFSWQPLPKPAKDAWEEIAMEVISDYMSTKPGEYP